MVINQAKVIENPIDSGEKRWMIQFTLASLAFGIFLCLIYVSLLPMISVTFFTAVAWIWNWYHMVYLNPRLVIIGEQGITIEFRYGRKTRFVPWHEISDIWISNNPKTVAEATIRCSNMKLMAVTKEIGYATYEKYTQMVGKPPA